MKWKARRKAGFFSRPWMAVMPKMQEHFSARHLLGYLDMIPKVSAPRTTADDRTARAR